MDDADELTRAAAHLERLAWDPAYRAAFRDAPCDGRAIQVLDGRESHSGLGGVLVAALVDGAAIGPQHVVPAAGAPEHHDRVHTPAAAGTGQVAVVQAEVPRGYPGDDASRRDIAAWMADEAERHGLPRELPVMASLVESQMQNLPGGDRSSVGYFQMQTDYWLNAYPDYPGKPELQMKWFVDQALQVRAKHPELAASPDRWGEWVASIERPDDSLRWKYGAHLEEARALVGSAHPAAAPAAPVASGTGMQPAVEAHRDEPADVYRAEARRIDGAHVPYQWGGGHAAAQHYGSPVTPLDCSGAVSRVLGIDPRVASEFEKWGSPGPGRRVTVYANDHHVLMEIDGHFWGTSNANPGGGAGWIPRSYMSDSYLAGFTMRHPRGE